MAGTGVIGVALAEPALLHVANLMVTTPVGISGVAGVGAGIAATGIAKLVERDKGHWDYSPYDHPDNITARPRRPGSDRYWCSHPGPDGRSYIRRFAIPAVSLAGAAGLVAAVAAGVHVEPHVASAMLDGATGLGALGITAGLTSRIGQRPRASQGLTE